MTKNFFDYYDSAVRGVMGLGATVALMMTLMLVSPIADAQDSDLGQRLERLERDIQTLSKMVVRGPGSVPTTAVPGSSGPAGASLPQNAVARIGVRLDAMENELRDVTGRLEELTYNLSQMTQRVDRLVADVDFRLAGLEQRGRPASGVVNNAKPGPGSPDGQVAQLTGAASSQTSGAPMPEPVQIVGQGPRTLGQIEAERIPVAGTSPTPDATGAPGTSSGAGPSFGKTASPGSTSDLEPVTRTSSQVVAQGQLSGARGTPTTAPQTSPQQAALPAGTPEKQYKFAFGLLRKHQFDHAEVAFRKFLEQNSSGPLSGNARYWLAETHYARAEYVKAAEVFLQGYETDPKGSKAPDSLLKLAMSLGQLGQAKEACGAIAKLFADFPNASSSLKRTATRQQREMNCK